MNREGTMLAIVRRDNATPEAAAKAFQRIIARHELEPSQLSRRANRAAAKSFGRPGAWLRTSDVDRLSEQEADIIAARLVRRTNAKTPLAKEKADALRRAISDIARRSFIQRDITLDQAQKLAVDAARRLLDESQFAAFNQAIDVGIRALPNEQ